MSPILYKTICYYLYFRHNCTQRLHSNFSIEIKIFDFLTRYLYTLNHRKIPVKLINSEHMFETSHHAYRLIFVILTKDLLSSIAAKFALNIAIPRNIYWATYTSLWETAFRRQILPFTHIQSGYTSVFCKLGAKLSTRCWGAQFGRKLSWDEVLLTLG